MKFVTAPAGFIGLDEAFEAIRTSDHEDFWAYDAEGRPQINPRLLDGMPDGWDPPAWADYRHRETTGEGPLIRAIKDGDLPIYDIGGRRILPKSFRMRCDLDWHRILITGEFLGAEGGEPLPLLMEGSAFRGWLRGLRDGRGSRPGRGAKPKYDWPAFEAEVRRLLDEEGGISPTVDPKFRQADVERHMASWCERSWGQAPAESSIRTHVVDAMKKAENSPN